MTDLQKQAANPSYSVWVAASAGTGKTKILTDRVLRLLLQGVEFHKILCLTFTNAASNEMIHRINQALLSWANSSTKSLIEALESILSRQPTTEEVTNAKILYHKILGSTEGINIYTIHSFCQKLLKNFPLEAGISPGFKVMDDTQTQEIIDKVKGTLYLDSSKENLLNFFIANFHEHTISDIFSEIISNRIKFKTQNRQDLGKLILELGFITNTTIATAQILEQIESISWPDNLSNLAQTLNSLESAKEFFLTKDGKKRAKLLTKAQIGKAAHLASELSLIQEEIYKIDQSKKLQATIEYSNLLAELALSLIHVYEDYKKQHSLLDYDDLIYLTKGLLTLSDAREWVLYKLDGGIEHLLVDEAQDTSPQQWEIIEALITEFYSGSSSNSSNRTIFVVGDEKQSIFSFQGANVASFSLMNRYLKEKLTLANKGFKVINLEYSYRSTSQILDVVYDVFHKIKMTHKEIFISDNPKIIPFRSDHSGKVEIWPLEEMDNGNEAYGFWPLKQSTQISPQRKLAQKIALFIKQQIDSGLFLPSKSRAAGPGDFMILVRKRDTLTIEILDQLKDHHLDVVGIDRMLLNKSLSVQDLISAAKFVLFPEDNLNLASLINSPIIAGNNDRLLEIIGSSPIEKSSLWERLQNLGAQGLDYSHVLKQLKQLIELYTCTNVSNFFYILVDVLGYRNVLLEANGTDTNEAIDELLYLSSDYAMNTSYALQDFIYWFQKHTVEVKRNIEVADGIRVMTAHSAKGLQAPVVILADTTSMPTNQNKFILTEFGLISTEKSTTAPDYFKDLKEQEHLKDLQEYLRLLYVAMTRAEDSLVVCGYKTGKSISNLSWYELIASSMKDLGSKGEDGVLVYGSSSMASSPAREEAGALRVQSRNILAHEDSSELSTKQFSSKVEFVERSNALSTRQFINEPKFAKNSNALSPLIPRYDLQYGRIFHKILEDSIKARHLEYLSIHPLIDSMPRKLQDKIRSKIDKLLLNEELRNIMKQKIYSELNIGYHKDGDFHVGRIDLIVKEEGRITIIDYKSDANPPAYAELIPVHYKEQLEFYRKAIEKIYPYHKVCCKILWLETAEFMIAEFI